MLWPVAKGSFSVSTWDEKTATMVTTLQEGYVQGALWQQVMNTNSGNFFLHGQ